MADDPPPGKPPDQAGVLLQSPACIYPLSGGADNWSAEGQVDVPVTPVLTLWKIKCFLCLISFNSTSISLLLKFFFFLLLFFGVISPIKLNLNYRYICMYEAYLTLYLTEHDKCKMLKIQHVCKVNLWGTVIYIQHQTSAVTQLGERYNYYVQ